MGREITKKDFGPDVPGEPDDAAVVKLNRAWVDYVDGLRAPAGLQNVTVVEILESRHPGGGWNQPHVRQHEGLGSSNHQDSHGSGQDLLGPWFSAVVYGPLPVPDHDQWR